FYLYFFSSRRRHTRSKRDWSSDVCSSDLSSFYRQQHSLAADKKNSTVPLGCNFSREQFGFFAAMIPREFHRRFVSSRWIFIADRSEERRVGKEYKLRMVWDREMRKKWT